MPPKELIMKETLELGEQGTLLFWDPIIRRALTEQAALQWICSAKPIFGRIYDLYLVAKVGEGWYFTDQPQTPGAFAYPVNIRFALEPELFLDKDVEPLSELQRINELQRKEEPLHASFRKKLTFVQRVEIPEGKLSLNGKLVYEVFKNETMQPTGCTNFKILLKD